MKIIFTYNSEKDIWCLLNYGKSSSNSAIPTVVYEQLIGEYGEVPSEKEAKDFIAHYISDNQIDVEGYIKSCEKDWTKFKHQVGRIWLQQE